MTEINLNAKRGEIEKLGKALFDKITSIPKEIRPDDKERTGIQIFIKKIGEEKVLTIPIYEPSDRAITFAQEKAERTEALNDYTSANSADPANNKFPGCVRSENILVSISGLFSEEDVVVGVRILSLILNIKVVAIIKQIEHHGGKLPEFFNLSSEPHYLDDIIYPKK